MSTDDRSTPGDRPTPGDRDAGPPQDVRDLLGAYALDAVDDVERRAVQDLLARDPEAAREVEGLQATAAMLGAAAAAVPPPGLRSDVLALISRVPQQGGSLTGTTAGSAGTTAEPTDETGADPSAEPADTPAPVPMTAPRAESDDLPAGVVPITSARSARGPRRTTTWLAVAATALGAAVVPSVLAVQQAQRGERAEQQAQALTELLADPDATVVRADVAGGGTAVGVLAEDRALFTAAGLTEPDDDRAYQLWVVRDGEALSAGVLAEEDGSVRALTDDYRAGDALAVTVEPAGGSAAPTSDPIVVLAPTEA